jgi:hypothetical protein
VLEHGEGAVSAGSSDLGLVLVLAAILLPLAVVGVALGRRAARRRRISPAAH